MNSFLEVWGGTQLFKESTCTVSNFERREENSKRKEKEERRGVEGRKGRGEEGGEKRR
jgi:hypothetical protein